MASTAGHTPVLLSAILALADIRPGQIIVDCTLGLGGYARAFAGQVGATGRVIGLEADPRNAERCRSILSDLDTISVVEANFRNVTDIVLRLGCANVDTVIFDLGLSSPHVDESERGFSYKLDGPLDMRFSPGDNPVTAATILNTATERELLTILKRFGEEPRARLIARMIVRERDEKPFVRTGDLVERIGHAVPPLYSNQTVKRVFQALRIAINDELQSLEEGLHGAFTTLRSDGKLIVVSYHSLEDTIIKDFFRSVTATCVCPRDIPVCRCDHPLAKNLTPRPITPSQAEVQANPRSRSARLRGIVKR